MADPPDKVLEPSSPEHSSPDPAREGVEMKEVTPALEVSLEVDGEPAVIDVGASLDPFQASLDDQQTAHDISQDSAAVPLLEQPVVEQTGDGMSDVQLREEEPQLEQVAGEGGGAPWTYCKTTVDNCREHYEDLDVKTFFITYFICFVITYGFTIMIQGGLGIPIYIYRGFDLDDISLSYPHMTSRVGGNTNIILTLAVTLMAFAMKAASEPDPDKQYTPRTAWSCTVLCMLKSLLNLKLLFDILIMLYGNIVMNFLTNSLKSLSGVLKPHFLQMCMLNTTIVDQLRAEGTSYVNETFTETICTNPEFADYRRSFPSGHTTQAAYCMLIAVLAIQSMKVKPEYSTLRGLGQLVCTLYVSFIAFDRIKDHHHHWIDATVGVALGSGVALVVWYGYITALSYREKPTNNRSRLLSSQSDSEIKQCLEKKTSIQHMSAC